MTLSYGLVTPARNEFANLRRLADSLAAQTRRPERWVIVDNGSTDATPDLARALARNHPWIELAVAPAADAARPGAPVVRAFHAGLARLEPAPDVVVKLDADVSMEPDHFERLLDEFERDPKLGISGGVCLELDADGAWQPTYTTAGHVRGAVRAYRWSCLRDILPLEEGMGWDGLDELKAATKGWTARMTPSVAFRHHRRVGERDGGRTRRWVAQGRGSHYMGYRFWYLVVRSLHHARSDPAALAMPWGFVRATLRRDPRCADPAVRALIRREQSLRNLPLRIREATGRAAG